MTDTPEGRSPEPPPAPTAPGLPHSIDRAKRDALASLPEGWNGHGEKPLTPESVVILDCLAVVPCSDGGLQVEWHANGWDVEITVAPDGTPEAFSMERAEVLVEAPPTPPADPGETLERQMAEVREAERRARAVLDHRLGGPGPAPVPRDPDRTTVVECADAYGRSIKGQVVTAVGRDIAGPWLSFGHGYSADRIWLPDGETQVEVDYEERYDGAAARVPQDPDLVAVWMRREDVEAWAARVGGSRQRRLARLAEDCGAALCSERKEARRG